MFVAGDSGVGKTRLLRELERLALARGVRVLRGDCLAFGADGLPYAPIAAALRGLARDLEPGVFAELVGPSGGDLARLLPELSAAHAADEPGEGMSATGEAIGQARLFGLLRALLDRLAEEAPVLFAVEDIHWADRSTLEFLSSLVRGLRDERLLVVCTYRSDELHRQHPLRPFLAEEERRAVVERLEVGAFSQAELAEQVAGILGDAAAPDLVARLHARCEGNAFFAEELLAASDAAAGPLPSSLRDVLNLRLEALPDDARGVLRVAAAAGRRSSHRLLAAVAGLPEPALVEALREALAQHVLVQDADGYAFRHALLQEAAYADLLPGERTALHLALAEALRDDPSLADGTAAAELALHWRAAHRMPEALAAYVRAGLEAEQVFAFVEAAQHFERALEIWDLVDDAAERAELELVGVVTHAAHNTHIAGEHHRAVALGRMAIELADRSDDVVSSAFARERLGRYLWIAGDSDGSLAAYRDAVRILPPDPPTPALARVLAAEAQILMLRAPGEQTRAACERAIEIARAVGARAFEGHALNSLGVTRFGVGDFAGGERALREAKSIAEEVSDHDGIWRAYTNLSECLDEQGRLEEAAALALEGAASADRLGMRTYAQFLQGEACWRLTRLGRLDETAAIVERVLAQGPKGVAAVVLHDNAAHLAMRRGRLDRAAEHFELARELLGGTSDSMWIGNQAAGRAETALWAADPEHAWQIATGALDFVPEDQYAHYTTRLHATALRAAADRAQRAHALGDEPRRRRGAARRPGDLRQPARPAGPRALARRRAGSRAGRLRRAGRRGALAGRGAPRPGRLGVGGRALRGAERAVRAGLRALAPGRGADRRRRRPGRGRRRPARGRRSRRRPGRAPARRRGQGPGPARARVAGRGAGRRRRGPRRRPPGAHRARAHRPLAGRRRPHQPRDRRVALHLREDRQRPRLAHPGQARRALARGGGDVRAPPGAGRDLSARRRRARVGARAARRRSAARGAPRARRRRAAR